MMKKVLATLTITAIFSLGIVYPAMATRSFVKDCEFSVISPEISDITFQKLSGKAKVSSITIIDPRVHTEETVIVCNNEETPAKSTVIQ